MSRRFRLTPATRPPNEIGQTIFMPPLGTDPETVVECEECEECPECPEGDCVPQMMWSRTAENGNFCDFTFWLNCYPEAVEPEWSASVDFPGADLDVNYQVTVYTQLATQGNIAGKVLTVRLLETVCSGTMTVSVTLAGFTIAPITVDTFCRCT